MIRRLSSLFSRWVGDDPNPEASHLDELDRMVVPALEPDPEPALRVPPAVAEFDAMTDEQRVVWGAECYLRRIARGVQP